MSPDDFTEGAAIDERFVWPISYDDLRPYYELVERRMLITAGDPIPGVPPNVVTFRSSPPGAWLPFVDRAAELGHGVGVLPMAKGTPWMAKLRSTGFNSYHAFVKPLLSDPRFQLLTGAVAVRVAPPVRPGLVTVVEYVDRGLRERRTLRARAVVVAAGALDSTKLLLASRTADFPQGVGNSHGLVGSYLHDHLRQWWPARLTRAMPLLTHPIYIARQPVGQNPPLMATSLTLGMVGMLTRLRGWYGGVADLIGVQVFGTVVPLAESTVRLVDRAPTGDPADDVVEISIRYTGDAKHNVAQARERFAEVFGSAGVAATPQGPFHEMTPGSSFHYGGTVRMHADPQYGVLDAWNRVYDAPSIVVCDASCFPTGPEKNPTLTAMAIAARAAKRLAIDLGHGPNDSIRGA
jgi:choline dehydrogenase-like flavoprotein